VRKEKERKPGKKESNAERTTMGLIEKKGMHEERRVGREDR
jgi:hypothetical protein